MVVRKAGERDPGRTNLARVGHDPRYLSQGSFSRVSLVQTVFESRSIYRT